MNKKTAPTPTSADGLSASGGFPSVTWLDDYYNYSVEQVTAIVGFQHDQMTVTHLSDQ